MGRSEQLHVRRVFCAGGDESDSAGSHADVPEVFQSVYAVMDVSEEQDEPAPTPESAEGKCC